MSKHSFYNLTKIKTGLHTYSEYVTNSKGLKKYITSVQIKDPELNLIVLNDNYAEFLGYANRTDLLIQEGRTELMNVPLYHEPLSNKLYLIVKAQPICLN